MPRIMCGDQRKEAGETCDGTDLAGQTCESLDFPEGGLLACTADCVRFDTSACYLCGNGVREGPEECDANDCGTDFGPTQPGESCGDAVNTQFIGWCRITASGSAKNIRGSLEARDSAAGGPQAAVSAY